MPKFLRKPEARLAPPPPTPRPVSAHEAEVIKRILHLEAGIPHVNELLASVDRLTVIEGCECGCDSLYFHEPRDKGSPIISGVGRTPGNNEVEVVLWARDTTLTFLEIEPWGKTLNPVRMPLAESIAPYTADAFGCDESDEGEEATTRDARDAR
jgi:hypothetical protein